MAGNVPVYDDEGDPAAGSEGADFLVHTDETVLVKEYDSKDAAILKLFFHKELKEISLVGLINCDPPKGPGLKLLIRSIKTKRAKVDPLIKDLDNKLKMIEEREVTVPSDAFAKLAEHMRSEEKRQIDAQQKELVLYRPDFVKKIVNIFFWPGNEKTVIKLKRELGIIETGGTRNRSAPSYQAEDRNPSVAGSGQFSDLKTSFSIADSSTFEGSISRELPTQGKPRDAYDERMDWKSRPQSCLIDNNIVQHHIQGWKQGHDIGQNNGSTQVHDSRCVKELHFDDLAITTEVKKLQAEKFKWGAVAQQFTLNTNLKVKIFKGDITKSVNDALVCGIGTDTQFSGLVADALKAAGGFDFKKAVSKTITSSKTGKPGKVIKCVSGKLKVNWVIFVVCDKLNDIDTKQLAMYRECVYNLMKRANEWYIPKIAIPLFKTENLQTNENNIQKCGIAFIRALDNFVDDIEGKHVNVKEIHLVNTSDLVTSTLVKVFDAASKHYSHDACKAAKEKQKYFEHGTEPPSDVSCGDDQRCVINSDGARGFARVSANGGARCMFTLDHETEATHEQIGREWPRERPPVMFAGISKREQCKQIVLNALGLKTWTEVEDSYDQADNMLQYTDDVSTSEGRIQCLSHALELAKMGKTKWTVHITVKRNGMEVPVDKQLIDKHSSQIIKEMKKKP
ncbi:uncharacterized protein LOC127858401 isoform X2 [Dreissena polymorpha]|uniref:uncharacterized protein LOC127858401 isoform X2 n=1 Tax=Dreissena polymorpha TaxID=45954 RepID=UPI002263AD47|nr:uncharacterized protein LOC127858401 isoform X2 [Dreissena polymorpha]